MASGSAAAGNGSAAAYADELAAAESAVRLACALCETVQRGLKAEESASKSDESPVTIADYGALTRGPWGVREWGVGGAEWAVGNGAWGMGRGEWAVGNGPWGMGCGEWAKGGGLWGMGRGEWAVGDGLWGMGRGGCGDALFSRSQVLVAWALQQHGLPGAFSMVAEEDSTQLTAPEGRGMLQRITALVNATIAASTKWGGGVAAPLSEAEVVALIDAGGAKGGRTGRHWVLDPIDGTRGSVTSAPPPLHPLPRTLILPPAAQLHAGGSIRGSAGAARVRRGGGGRAGLPQPAPCYSPTPSRARPPPSPFSVMRGDQYAVALGLLDQGEVVVGVLCFSALPHCSPCTPSPLSSPLSSPPSPPPPHHSFMRGDQYAVALGLLDQGDVVVGVLGCPNLPCASIAHGVEAAVATGQPVGCVFSAVKGRGTTVQPLHEAVPPRQVRRGGVEVGGWGGGDVGGLRWGGWRKGGVLVPSVHQVQVSSESNPAMATFCESYESRHSKHNLTASIAQALGVVAPPVRIDSQAKYGAMARGDAAIYMRFPPDGYREKIWDHAAGSLVISGRLEGKFVTHLGNLLTSLVVGSLI
ncbi:unnamed protein product [Closterium sp. Naga37s-1]|nr:unnamed protein product [Closterium sp. Naga37s-1]